MAIFNSLTFAGVNSLDFGIYITGEAVYNAPVRSVEAVAIPGRDGDLIIDNGRFENLEVTYPAGCFGDDQTSFAERVRNFRNAVASKRGYQRLTDTYNPNEYRLGLFINGLEVEPVGHGRAGEFELVFNCKPFRYTLDGETAVTVPSGTELTNPTQFDSMPLLAVDGYGDIQLNGYDIGITNEIFGTVRLLQAYSSSKQQSSVAYGVNVGTVGDSMVLDGLTFKISVLSKTASDELTETGGTNISGDLVLHKESRQVSSRQIDFTFTASPDLLYRTAETHDKVIRIDFTNGSHSASLTITMSVTNTATGNLTFRISTNTNTYLAKKNIGVSFSSLTLDSTKSVLGEPTYIDCDLGEAYKIVDGELISLNSYIDLGSDLPVLAPGTNEITYSGNITNLAITPRWRLL